MPYYLKNKKGSSLILIIVFMMLFMIIVVGISSTLSFGINSSIVQRNYSQAYYGAKTINMAITDTIEAGQLAFVNNSITSFEDRTYCVIPSNGDDPVINPNLSGFETSGSTILEADSDFRVFNKITVNFNNLIFDRSDYENGETVKMMDLTSFDIIVQVSTTANYRGHEYSLVGEMKQAYNSSGGGGSWSDLEDLDDNVVDSDGNIIGDVDGNIISNDSDISIITEGSNINIGGNILTTGTGANGNVTIINGNNNNINIDGSIYVSNESTTVSIENNNNGNITVNETYSMGDININLNNNGTITLSNIYVDVNVTITSVNNGPIYLGNICSNGTITILNENNGNINIGDLSAAGSINIINTNNGNIITKDITSGGNIDLKNDGNGNIDAEYISSVGIITLSGKKESNISHLGTTQGNIEYDEITKCPLLTQHIQDEIDRINDSRDGNDWDTTYD
ncbi:MAG: hypothetical protein AB7V48_03370 [Sedimentibacter sp.]